MRVLSLLPSATEIVCALGARGDLVGRSEECDYPVSVKDLPVVMRARTLDGDRPSAEIDARVRTVRHAGESLYTLDLDRLGELAPDVVLTQDLCRVCSVTEGEVAHACQRAGITPIIVTLSPRRLEDVWQSVEVIGDAIGRVDEGRRLESALRARARSAAAVGSSPVPRIAVVEWLDPPFLAGLWTPDLVAAAGATPIGPLPGSPGVRTDWTAVARARPDLVVLSPCSFDVGRTRRELDTGSIGAQLGALRLPRGFVLADEAYFSRPGPRLADGVELLARLARGEAPTGPMRVEAWLPSREAPPA